MNSPDQDDHSFEENQSQSSNFQMHQLYEDSHFEGLSRCSERMSCLGQRRAPCELPSEAKNAMAKIKKKIIDTDSLIRSIRKLQDQNTILRRRNQDLTTHNTSLRAELNKYAVQNPDLSALAQRIVDLEAQNEQLHNKIALVKPEMTAEGFNKLELQIEKHKAEIETLNLKLQANETHQQKLRQREKSLLNQIDTLLRSTQESKLARKQASSMEHLQLEMQQYLTTKDYPLLNSDLITESCERVLSEFNKAVVSLVPSLSLSHCFDLGYKLISSINASYSEILDSLFSLISDSNQSIFFSTPPNDFISHPSCPFKLKGKCLRFMSQCSFTNNLLSLYVALYSAYCEKVPPIHNSILKLIKQILSSQNKVKKVVHLVIVRIFYGKLDTYLGLKQRRLALYIAQDLLNSLLPGKQEIFVKSHLSPESLALEDFQSQLKNIQSMKTQTKQFVSSFADDLEMAFHNFSKSFKSKLVKLIEQKLKEFLNCQTNGLLIVLIQLIEDFTQRRQKTLGEELIGIGQNLLQNRKQIELQQQIKLAQSLIKHNHAIPRVHLWFSYLDNAEKQQLPQDLKKQLIQFNK